MVDSIKFVSLLWMPLLTVFAFASQKVLLLLLETHHLGRDTFGHQYLKKIEKDHSDLPQPLQGTEN